MTIFTFLVMFNYQLKSSEAALFFCTYENLKRTLSLHVNKRYAPYIHMGAASIGEMVLIQQNEQKLHSEQFGSFLGGMFDSSSGRNS